MTRPENHRGRSINTLIKENLLGNHLIASNFLSVEKTITYVTASVCWITASRWYKGKRPGKRQKSKDSVWQEDLSPFALGSGIKKKKAKQNKPQTPNNHRQGLMNEDYPVSVQEGGRASISAEDACKSPIRKTDSELQWILHSLWWNRIIFWHWTFRGKNKQQENKWNTKVLLKGEKMTEYSKMDRKI